MRDVIERVKGTWLFQRPPDYLPPRRIVTILMWLAMVGTPLVGGLAFWLDARADLRSDERDACQQRVDSRDLVRGVLLGLAVRLSADDETEELVANFLDEEYPALELADCLNPPPLNTTLEE